MSEQIPANESAIDRPPVTADVAPPTVDAAGAPQTRIGRFKLPTESLRAYTMLFALIVIWLFLQWKTMTPDHPYGLFLDPVNFSKLLKQTAVTGILAVGMLMVIVAGQIDLSVGSVVGLAGGTAAMMQVWGAVSLHAPTIVIGSFIGLIAAIIAYILLKRTGRDIALGLAVLGATLTVASSGIYLFTNLSGSSPVSSLRWLITLLIAIPIFFLLRQTGRSFLTILAVITVGLIIGLIGGYFTPALATKLGWENWGVWLLILTLGSAIVVALAIGIVQGSLVSYANIPAFIVTLGGLLAWRGVVLWRMKGETYTVELPVFRSIGEGFLAPIAGWTLAALAIIALVFFTLRRNRARRRHGLAASGSAVTLARIVIPSVVIAVFIYMMNTQGGVPIPVFVFLTVALVGGFLTQNTTFGRYLYAVGGNPDAARLSGINLRRHILLAFCIMGVLAGLGALVYTARNGSAAGDAGSLMELDAIAACVIGGTSLMGGRGTVFGACLGALIMASLDNGMSLLNVQNEIQMIVKGAVLVAAVGFDMLGRRRS